MSVELGLGPAGQDYEDIRPLNSKAGMSDLFRAHKKGMNIDVVIKRVQRKVQSNIDEKNESEILKKLKHQYLPQIYDIIPGEDGYLYTVMDLIEGVNLQDYVKKHGPITQKQVHLWGCQLCEAVQYLQEEKEQKPTIIHCDIKPSNVMVTKNGDICLIDFGTSLISHGNMQASAFLTKGYAAPEQHYLARTKRNIRKGYASYVEEAIGAKKAEAAIAEETVLADQEETILAQNGSDETLLAPESASIRSAAAVGCTKTDGEGPQKPDNEGKKRIRISKATDIYAIGATLYYAVTAKRPEESIKDVEPLRALKPAVSDSIIAIIDRAMQKEPEKRFKDATAMLEALHNVDQMDRSYQRYIVQKRLLTAGLGIALLLSISSTAYGFYQMRLERENTYLNIISQAEEAKAGGDYEEGRTLLEKAIQQQPTRPDAYMDLAVLLYQQGQYQAAIDVLADAVQSRNLKLDGMSEAEQGEFYYVQGSCLYESKQYKKAIEALSRAVELSSETTAYYRSLAIALANNDQIEEAQLVLQELAQKGASSSDCDIVSAEIAAMQGQYKTAMTLYKKVFRETDDQQLLSHAYLMAAQLSEDNEDLPEAVSILEQAQKVLATNYSVLQRTMLADLYGQMAIQNPEQKAEYYEKAEKLLLELIESGMGTLATRLNMASVQQAMGNYEKAEQYLLELEQLYPQDYRVEMQLAYLYIDWQGTMDVEKRNYEQALMYYISAKEKYQQALANGQEDQNMAVLTNLISQLQSSGWLEEEQER